MAVWVRQYSGAEVSDHRALVSPAGLADEDYLRVKAASHDAKGWDVRWEGDSRFVAVKDRWGGTLCQREFWVVA